MRIHHYYPRTKNIGDHFVQLGIQRMIRELRPNATFELFDVNSRGEDKIDYGLTRLAVERANKDADLIVVGGSNLYEGSFRWSWGVHLDVDALQNLRVPLFLLGIGSGSGFISPLHKPAARALHEIKLLNEHATFSGVRDVSTYDWLQSLGLTKTKLIGDPATFVFSHPQRATVDGHILITLPPRRFWVNKRQFWKVQTKGRAMFRALVTLTRDLLKVGRRVIVACNDPLDLPVAATLFGDWLPGGVVCPATPEEYFPLITKACAVVSGRLHTAVLAFSAGVPFLLFDVDQRTNGFIKTYQLERWSVRPLALGMEKQLAGQVADILSPEPSLLWKTAIEKRNAMHSRAIGLLREAFSPIN
jgi:polysaccharide pyruvyl transferase WcaK-like protein